MSIEDFNEILTGLTRVLFGRMPTSEDYSLAETLSWNVHDLRIRFLMSEEAHARWPELRTKINDYFENTLSQELKRSTELRRLGLPRPLFDLAPDPPPQHPALEISNGSKVEMSLAVISTKNYVPYAHVTMSSFRAFHSDIPIFLLLVDGTSEDRSLVSNCTTVLLSDLELPNRGWYTAKYDASQLANAVKPAFLLYLRQFARRALYFDADIAVFSPCHELLKNTRDSDLVLTPHTTATFPRPEQLWAHPNNADIFHSGLFNAGVFGIDLDRCSDFLEFWINSNFSVGAFYGPAGGQTDQQYLNWAIVLQSNVHILRDPAYNVAYWNLHDRDLRTVKEPTPVVQVNGRPLVIFHFSGFDIYNPLQLSKHDNRYSVYNLHFIAELLIWYSQKVLSGPHSGLLAAPYPFDVLPNGFRLTEFVRGILKQYENYFPKYDPQNGADADRLCRFLMTPLPATVAAVIYDLRTDLQTAFPGAHTNTSLREFWRWFCQHAGREYGIEFLIDKHRNILVSDSLVGFSEQLEQLFQRSSRCFLFLGNQRVEASAFLRACGRNDLSDSLLAGDNEWFFYTPLSAVISTYLFRPDLQLMFPKIFGESHGAFSDWLHANAGREHGISEESIEVFDGSSSEETLSRIFNYLSRRNDIAELISKNLLADDNKDLVQVLLRDSAEGMEYATADVEIFIFLHRRERELLVPVFLELPKVRREGRSARVPYQKSSFLPEAARGKPWANAGCRLHESYFELFEGLVEDEVKGIFSVGGSAPAHIFDVIRRIDVRTSASQAFTIASAAARRRMRQYDRAAFGSCEAVKTSRAHGHVPIVNVFGFFYADTGVGESARGLARAIGYLRDVQRLVLPTGSLQEGVPLNSLFHRFNFESDTNVIVSYPHQHEDYFGTLPREYFWGRKNIVHLAWEQKDWNPHWKAVYDRYDEIWAISKFAALPFQEMFGDRVRVVPNVLNFEEYPRFDNEVGAQQRHSKFRFLYVFDANSSIERKNPEGCLDAFIKAFEQRPEGKHVQLYLKVGNLSRPEHAVRVERLRRKATLSGLDVFFDGRKLTRGALMKLIASADCYVSLHRAEGFGYTIAEAMYYSMRVIASDYSGNLEYMTARDSFLVPCVETFVKEADGPFQRGSIWGEPNLDAAIAYMRDVVSNRAKAREIGKRGHAAVSKKLNARAIGELLRPALVHASNNCPAVGKN